MALFGSRKRVPLQSAALVPQMIPQTAQPEEMAPVRRPRGLFSSAAPVSLDVADVGVALPPTQSVQGMPRPSYNGPEFNRMQVIGAMLQQLGDNRGQLNDLYQMEDQRQRGEFDRQRQEQMMAALANDPNIPESVRGFLPYAPEAVLSGVIGGQMKRAFPDPQKAQGPLAIGPGTELIDRDPRTGMPIIDPATGKPRVLYSNTNYAPRNSRAPIVAFDPTADNPDVEWEDKR